MTLAQLRADLEKEIVNIFAEPLVSIKQLNFNITVLGRSEKPGQYTNPSDKITVLQALGLAGDMTDYGNRTNVKLIREEDGVSKTFTLILRIKILQILLIITCSRMMYLCRTGYD